MFNVNKFISSSISSFWDNILYYVFLIVLFIVSYAIIIYIFDNSPKDKKPSYLWFIFPIFLVSFLHKLINIYLNNSNFF